MDSFLTKKGHKCTVSNNANDGIALIQDNEFDIILLDMSMPEMDGNEFLEKLEHEGLLKKQKIIVMTAHSLSALEIELLMSKHGICWFLKKPLSLSELLETIESLHNMEISQC
ncbi:MAG: response regulator [Nitrosopumilus sp.]|nr:response regulator [Nitrosopumilus sp.]